MSAPQNTPTPGSRAPIVRDPALRMDRFVTWVFIGFAVITVMSSIAQYTNMEQYLSEFYQQFAALQPGFSVSRYPDADLARVIGLSVMTIDAALLGFTVWWSVTRMNANRRAVWVPVVGWLLSTVSSTILVAYAISQDQAFVTELTMWMRRVSESGLPTIAPAN